MSNNNWGGINSGWGDNNQGDDHWYWAARSSSVVPAENDFTNTSLAAESNNLRKMASTFQEESEGAFRRAKEFCDKMEIIMGKIKDTEKEKKALAKEVKKLSAENDALKDKLIMSERTMRKRLASIVAEVKKLEDAAEHEIDACNEEDSRDRKRRRQSPQVV